MHRSLTLFSSLAVVVSAGGAMGCSSSSSPSASPAGCTSMTVSFSKDVAPAFVASGCSLSNVCHGQPNLNQEEDLFLGAGPPAVSTDPKIIYDGLVGVTSKENPDMKLVVASDTASSYLWHKIAGDQNTDPTVMAGCKKAATVCSNCTTMPPCGASMPYTASDALEVGEPDNFCIIQNWIEQGAKND